jgi:2Fe-2S ferredoxin
MASREKLKRLLKRSRSLARKFRKPGQVSAPAGPATVEFGALSVEVPAHSTVLEAAIQLDLDLDHFCGGNCSCGTCRIQVIKGGHNLSPARPNEQMVLGPEAEEQGDRLACQARVSGPVSIVIPEFFMV